MKAEDRAKMSQLIGKIKRANGSVIQSVVELVGIAGRCEWKESRIAEGGKSQLLMARHWLMQAIETLEILTKAKKEEKR